MYFLFLFLFFCFVFVFSFFLFDSALVANKAIYSLDDVDTLIVKSALEVAEQQQPVTVVLRTLLCRAVHDVPTRQ